MPWPTNADLPKNVRDTLPNEAQTVFRIVGNSVFANGGSEESAFIQAWAAVKAGWKPPEDGEGKWIKKIGARHTKDEYEEIQKIHDTVVGLGATCAAIEKAQAKSLYIRRQLLNSAEFVEWAKSNGFSKTLIPDDLHVTVAFSKSPIEWPEPINDILTITDRDRTVKRLGDKGAVVLSFESPTLELRHNQILDMGGSFDFDQYIPHITISYDADDVDVDAVSPYLGQLVFGPEIHEDINENFADEIIERRANVVKVSEELGIVFGWAIVCSVNKEPYFDTQGDYIPEHSMLKASAEFMQHSRTAGHMHNVENAEADFQSGDYVEKAGTVVFAFPLTEEISKALEIECKYTGLLIGMKIEDKAILEKFKSGEYTGFSIGGRAITAS